jgi:hypothetical protein
MRKHFSQFQKLTGVKAVKLSERFGVSRSYISRMKNGSDNDTPLGGMMIEFLDEAIQAKQNELAELLVLKVQIETEAGQ